MSSTNFRKIIRFRTTEEQIQTIEWILQENNEKYNNKSQFIRCAVIQLIESEKEWIKITTQQRRKKERELQNATNKPLPEENMP